jgi:hypothetical protein
MSDLLASPYNLIKGDLITVKVQASNTKGWGDLSDPSNLVVTVETVPDTMLAPLRGAQTTGTAVHVTWSAIATGSSASGGQTTSIISYHLQWDQGNPASTTWSDLQGLSPSSTAT